SVTGVQTCALPISAGVDKIFFARINPQLVDPLTLDAVVAHKCHRHVSVPEEANSSVLVSEARGRVEVVEDVAPVLGRIEGRVKDGEITNLPLKLQRPQPFFVRVAQMI